MKQRREHKGPQDMNNLELEKKKTIDYERLCQTKKKRKKNKKKTKKETSREEKS